MDRLDEFNLIHHTTIKAVISILKSGYISTPKRLQLKTWSDPEYVFFNIIPMDVIEKSTAIYIKPSVIYNKSFFIHPTSNNYGPNSKNTRFNKMTDPDCECMWEYISPRLQVRLQLDGFEPSYNCKLTFEEAVDKLVFDYDVCDGGNEVGVNDPINIRDILGITIEQIDFDNLNKNEQIDLLSMLKNFEYQFV